MKGRRLTRKPRTPWAARTETVTIRLTPRARYISEIAARVQRRTLSSFVEGVINDALRTIRMKKGGATANEAVSYLWDVDADARFVALASHHPELLTFDEEVAWKQRRKRKKGTALAEARARVGRE